VTPYLPLLGRPRGTAFAFVSVSVTLRTLFTPETLLALALTGGTGFNSEEATVMNPITASTTQSAVLLLIPVTNSSTYLIVVTCFSLCQSALEGLVCPSVSSVFGARIAMVAMTSSNSVKVNALPGQHPPLPSQPGRVARRETRALNDWTICASASP
jgi:hypothetical protein